MRKFNWIKALSNTGISVLTWGSLGYLLYNFPLQVLAAAVTLIVVFNLIITFIEGGYKS